MEIYERSRRRNHSHDVSASSSLVWANRSLGNGGMASTRGVPNQESEINCAYPIALPTAFGSPRHSPPERQRVRNQIKAAFIFSRADFVNVLSISHSAGENHRA
jgi:hypothetical protein